LVVASKTLLQASAIAIIYLAVFFRHGWSIASDTVRAPFVVAARARGVPERDLLWHHTHRRTLPIVVLVLGLTLPAFVGTQAFVEAMFSDQGVGYILISEVAGVESNRPGLSGPNSGNFYQVLVFLLAIFLLISTLCADILARYLDPRLQRGEP
jgi:peptide/nickel transport system permease protein